MIFFGRRLAGSARSGSTMKCRISTSNSTHSCTKTRSTRLPGCSASCFSEVASSCFVFQACTSMASQDQPSLATPFTTGTLTAWSRRPSFPFQDARLWERCESAVMAFAAALPGSDTTATRETCVVSGTFRSGCRHICAVHSFEAKMRYRCDWCGKRVGTPVDSRCAIRSKSARRSTYAGNSCPSWKAIGHRKYRAPTCCPRSRCRSRGGASLLSS
mmetsp:Transcript_28496/g.72084  ORF Transcript_28496/g.72084 Transcript_28496/m.72084 type:complete len:216 (-) Transcript_28496:564-1211(-)